MSDFPWWDRQSIALFDQILFLPPSLSQEAAPLKETLQGPLAVEFCSGNGSWIVQKALENPGTVWLAVEKKLERAKKIWKRAKRLSVTNILVICGPAEVFVTHVLPESSITEAYINFPDPWPKRRHAKHRLVQEDFVIHLKQKMQKGASLTLVTDDYPFLQESLSVFQQYMTPLLPPPYFAADLASYGVSFFEDLWRRKNKTIHYTVYANH